MIRAFDDTLGVGGKSVLGQFLSKKAVILTTLYQLCVWLSGKTNNCSSSEERRQKESENCTKAKKA